MSGEKLLPCKVCKGEKGQWLPRICDEVMGLRWIECEHCKVTPASAASTDADLRERMARAFEDKMGPVFGSPEYLADPIKLARAEKRRRESAEAYADIAMSFVAPNATAQSARIAELEAENARLRGALEFYATSDIYKPHPHGVAFERRDLSYRARAALASEDKPHA